MKKILMEQNLTDRSFWKAFWESRKGLIFFIKRNYVFGDILSKLIAEKNVKNAIELGGFPGYYATYLKKYENLDTTLFDYYIHHDLINQLLERNGLKPGDINIIEADLFNYTPEKLYDMVLSFGLIEHFNDTKAIIDTHLHFLKPGGVLFITLPNFKSVNGWVQRNFDKENYDKHNINSMDLTLLKDCCRQLGLKEIEAYYHGRFTVWLENKSEQSGIAKAITKAIWVVGKVFTKIVPVESKALSPYIVVKAVK
ncbi:bifunctional 2-polyprenyl-6-hydroxyphenol methylase/3-demethylubiquinol 3-O-methyltransferase UbiG [Mucilaginibacter sp. L3T2-6]|uniref:class I SAM-dependent methyltransferase n=1 Tax=Mucilaginibacter sp. L3T2-6 TaxID=3062491 RepID=UPI002675534D|nr:methyltransferase domain-containing protein [Mucilaginibacter sp. L3T2-6]MDO3640618.1 methyltransferase domain-containing protein [Mucilaginibacter sp. L3T2-6]MDV6213043.1 methyltransferase domain-containing protein [Mucilaginibacter sp. L3T2-6]